MDETNDQEGRGGECGVFVLSQTRLRTTRLRTRFWRVGGGRDCWAPYQQPHLRMQVLYVEV
eukprot:9029272-Pyramimonas_sp.AAC.1